MFKDGCINRIPKGRTPVETRTSDTLLINNKVQADMNRVFNKKSGNPWLRQCAYNASVRRELRQRGLPIAPIVGKKTWKE